MLAISQSKQFFEAMFQVVLFNVTVIFMALKIACYANLFACFCLKLIDLEKNAINCSFTLIDWIKRKMFKVIWKVYSQTKFMLHVKSEFQFILLKQTEYFFYQKPNSNIPISLRIIQSHTKWINLKYIKLICSFFRFLFIFVFKQVHDDNPIDLHIKDKNNKQHLFFTVFFSFIKDMRHFCEKYSLKLVLQARSIRKTYCIIEIAEAQQHN